MAEGMGDTAGGSRQMEGWKDGAGRTVRKEKKDELCAFSCRDTPVLLALFYRPKKVTRACWPESEMCDLSLGW